MLCILLFTCVGSQSSLSSASHCRVINFWLKWGKNGVFFFFATHYTSCRITEQKCLLREWFNVGLFFFFFHNCVIMKFSVKQSPQCLLWRAWVQHQQPKGRADSRACSAFPAASHSKAHSWSQKLPLVYVGSAAPAPKTKENSVVISGSATASTTVYKLNTGKQERCLF